MIILDATTEKLQLVLAGAITTNQLQYTTSFVDVTTTTYTPSNSEGLSNNTTDVDIVGAPGDASTQRQIKQITVYNNDTVSSTVTIKKDVSGTDKILCKVVLAAQDTLQYNDGTGFEILSGRALKCKNTDLMAFAAGTQTGSSGTIQFSDANSVSFGLQNNQLTASYEYFDRVFYEPPRANLNANAAHTVSTAGANLSLQRFIVLSPIVATRLDLGGYITVAGSTTGSWSISVGIYTRSQSTISTVSSTSSGQAWSTGSGSDGFGSNDTNCYHGVSGSRWRSFSCANWSFTPGEYWFGIINTVVGVAGTTGSVTFWGQSSQLIGGLPGANNDVIGMDGLFSNQTGAFPDTINVSDILYCSTGTIQSHVFRQPYFRMFGNKLSN